MKKKNPKVRKVDHANRPLNLRKSDILYGRSMASLRRGALRLLHGNHRLPKDQKTRSQYLSRMAADHGLIILPNKTEDGSLTICDAETQSWLLDYYPNTGKALTIELSSLSTTVQGDPVYAIHMAAGILKRLRAKAVKPTTKSVHRSRGRPRNPAEVRQVYPRQLRNTFAESKGIEIVEVTDNEMRFNSKKNGDLLLLWNRSTRKARFALSLSSDLSILDLKEAILLAETRLHIDRIRVGSVVELINLTEKSFESFTIVDSHFSISHLNNPLPHNSPLGSQLLGLNSGLEVSVKVPMGTLLYKIERVN